MRFWISDTHFGHANIIKHCNRPFANVEEMDAALIQNWNNVVRDEDDVIHLGDFCLNFKRIADYLPLLNGRKTLVLGNHDGNLQQMKDVGFDDVYQDFSFRLGVKKVFCMHRPKSLTGYNAGKWLLHGHTHEKSPKIDLENKRINLSVEHWNYSPVSEEDIVKIIR